MNDKKKRKREEIFTSIEFLNKTSSSGVQGETGARAPMTKNKHAKEKAAEGFSFIETWTVKEFGSCWCGVPALSGDRRFHESYVGDRACVSTIAFSGDGQLGNFANCGEQKVFLGV